MPGQLPKGPAGHGMGNEQVRGEIRDATCEPPDDAPTVPGSMRKNVPPATGAAALVPISNSGCRARAVPVARVQQQEGAG
jgi:hypothetical protein